jgi:hypothetical protein
VGLGRQMDTVMARFGLYRQAAESVRPVVRLRISLCTTSQLARWLKLIFMLWGPVQIVFFGAFGAHGFAAERVGTGEQRPSFTLPREMQQRPAVSMEDLLAKSTKNRLLSVVVRLRVDSPKDKARPSVIKAAQEKLQNGLSGTGSKSNGFSVTSRL